MPCSTDAGKMGRASGRVTRKEENNLHVGPVCVDELGMRCHLQACSIVATVTQDFCPSGSHFQTRKPGPEATLRPFPAFRWRQDGGEHRDKL